MDSVLELESDPRAVRTSVAFLVFRRGRECSWRVVYQQRNYVSCYVPEQYGVVFGPLTVDIQSGVTRGRSFWLAFHSPYFYAKSLSVACQLHASCVSGWCC